jgi:hypothetical protein
MPVTNTTGAPPGWATKRKKSRPTEESVATPSQAEKDGGDRHYAAVCLVIDTCRSQ